VGFRAVMRPKVVHIVNVSVCVCFALVIRRASHIFSTQHCIAICGLSWLYHFFFSYDLINSTIFAKIKLLNIKCVF